MRLEEVAARLEIQQVLTQYCRGVDRCDPSLIKEAFHEDAVDEHGPFVGKGWELAERLGLQPGDPVAGGQHQIFNIYIEFDADDEARVESYVMAYHPRRAPDGSDELLVFAGRYLDRFEQRDGAWKIASRRVISDFHRVEELDPPMDGYPAGRRGPGVDLAYELFPAR
jgi:hypothetical protein